LLLLDSPLVFIWRNFNDLSIPSAITIGSMFSWWGNKAQSTAASKLNVAQEDGGCSTGSPRRSARNSPLALPPRCAQSSVEPQAPEMVCENRNLFIYLFIILVEFIAVQR
jgi:hypothetical protein